MKRFYSFDESSYGETKLNEKGVPYGAREKMPFWYSLAWSTRGISAALNVVLVGYIMYYCIDMLGSNALTVGTMLPSHLGQSRAGGN